MSHSFYYATSAQTHSVLNSGDGALLYGFGWVSLASAIAESAGASGLPAGSECGTSALTFAIYQPSPCKAEIYQNISSFNSLFAPLM